MLVTRLTMIFQLSTTPTDLTSANIHVGGWTESIWTTMNSTGYTAPLNILATKRAIMLPTTAKIVGLRAQAYTIQGNKLLPGGSASTRNNYPGAAGTPNDLPQVALQVSIKSQFGINSSRQMLRGMPDLIMKGGEYQPQQTDKTNFTNYATALKATGFGFVGRDLAQPAVRVENILGGNQIQVSAVPAGLAIGDYVRLNRVVDDSGVPVSGAFRVDAIQGRIIIVFGLVAAVGGPSGTLRKDLLDFFQNGSVLPIRACIKKIGGPSERYRGRRSKVRK